MQNDFLSPGGWLDSVGVDVSSVSALVDPLNEATRVLRSQEVKIIWLNWGNRKDQANLPPGVLHVYDPDGKGCGIGSSLANGSKVLEAGSWSAALVDGVETGATDFFVDKYRMSGFFDTPLDSILRNLAVTTVLFAGVNIDQCVYGTLIDAACLGYDVILLEDISGTTSPSYCFEATIYNVAQCYGFVTTSRSLIEALKR
jgi:nicotinamidase-related amidase